MNGKWLGPGSFCKGSGHGPVLMLPALPSGVLWFKGALHCALLLVRSG